MSKIYHNGERKEAALLGGGIVEDYEKEDIKSIRKMDTRLNGIPDEIIRIAYQEWSDIYYAAGWISATSSGLKSFLTWALQSPLERISKEING